MEGTPMTAPPDPRETAEYVCSIISQDLVMALDEQVAFESALLNLKWAKLLVDMELDEWHERYGVDSISDVLTARIAELESGQ